MEAFRLFSPVEQKAFVSEALSIVASQQFEIDLPEPFIELAMRAMQKLAAAGRSNVIYGLCKGLGTCRPDYPNESLFPTSRMPMGLLEYMVDFFTSEAAHNVSCLFLTQAISMYNINCALCTGTVSISSPLLAGEHVLLVWYKMEQAT